MYCEGFSVATESAQLLLSDLAREFLDKGRAAKAEACRSGTDYDKGRQYAYFEVISLISQQAEAFGLDLASIGLDRIDPERELLG
jgi:hypothetical protein